MSEKINPFEENKDAWITFVMPVYNEQRRVRSAIMSVISQDYPNTELIVVNDGSSDKSVREIKRAERQMTKQQRTRFKFINLKENVGACKARNIGAVESKGDYLAFLPADAYLYPGVSRFWVSMLEERPDYDFLYGAYRFVSQKQEFGLRNEDAVANVYPSRGFSPYILETSNYIDGTFPIRRKLFEKMGGWDESIKSLQDWEYWLRAVKIHGAKGFYVPEPFFETEWPEAGGLSDDSASNWLERSDKVKDVIGIPKRTTCVMAFGAHFHAINMAKMLDADFAESPNFKPNRYELIYVVGGYPQFIDKLAKELREIPYIDGSPMCQAKKALHWIGSDVMMMRGLPRQELEIIVNFYNNVFDEQLCECPHIQKELKDLGIKAKIVPIPTERLYKPLPLPKKPTVACYMPGSGMKEIYNPALMIAVAKAMPDIDFKFYGDPAETGKKKNVKCMGYIDGQKAMDKFIADSSILVRITKHDGLPLSIPEFITAGRNVVTNVPLPHIDVVLGQPTVEGLCKVIRGAITRKSTKKAQDYYRKLMDVKDFKRKIEKIGKYVPKEYWEARAVTWVKQAGMYLEKYEIKKVKEAIKKLKPESVLDVGCGNGQWIPYLPEKYTGIDISSKLIEYCEATYPNKDFLAQKLEDASVEPGAGKYDLAFCHTVFLHITEKNMEKAVRALKNVALKAIIIEPENVKTINYQHGHKFEDWFKIEKKIPMKNRTMYIVDLSEDYE